VLHVGLDILLAELAANQSPAQLLVTCSFTSSNRYKGLN
jgi:hypothetical protein